jgi:hypothetical protein
MKRDDFYDRYLALDKNERVPLALTLHLLLHAECRTSIRRLTRAERLLAAPFSITLESPVSATFAVEEALRRVREASLSYPETFADDGKVSLYRWFIAGVALIAGFGVFPFSYLGDWVKDAAGAAFYAPFFIVCGLAITMYCGMFVAANIDFFVKKFGFRHSPA